MDVYFSLVIQIMKMSQKTTAPSARRLFNETGVRRIPGRSLRIGTWNVRSLKSPEKLYNIVKEMERLKVDIMGLSDVKWRGNGEHPIDREYTLYYSGSDESSNMYGVGVIINTKKIKAPVTFVPQSNRSMLLSIEVKPRKINIIQVYAPTTDGTDQDVEDFYSETEQLLNTLKKHDINVVMGDMNAKVGEGEVQGIIGKYGLGKRNARGDTLVQFCQEQELAIMNTYFQLPARRLYTWTSPRHTPEHIMRNQIDYIMINNRFRNSIKSAKTYPGADIRSDHNPVVAELSCTLKKIQKELKRNKIDPRLIHEAHVRPLVSNKVNEWAVVAKQQPSVSVEDTWNQLKTKVHEANQIILASKSWVPKQPWMNDRIYELIEKRRLHKTDKDKYEEFDKQIRREVRYARNSWYRKKCEHLEELQRKHDAFNLHKEIKALVGHKIPTYQLWDENNQPVVDTAKKKLMWKQYIVNMFADDTRSSTPQTCDTDGYTILEDEVTKALRRAKTGKSPGPDEVHIEILKLIEPEHISSLTKLMNLVYDTGSFPDDWLKSVFVTLPKKPNAKKCEEYRTISLMSQVLKLFLTIIHERIRVKCDEQLGDNQFGFRAGVGTREALFALQVLVQKCKDMQQDVYLCFVDYEKAFDRVLHDRLTSILHDIGLDGKDIRVIQNLYWNQRAAVRVEGEETEDIVIRRGVRQGCILSPTLFNLYSEAIISEALTDLDCGIKVNGRIVNNLRYADDTVLMASTESDLQKIVDRLNECSLRAGLKMNAHKTKVMVISKRTLSPNISVSSERLDVVRKYKYLGTWLTDDWESETEIKTRIEIARSAFNKMRAILSSRSISIPLRTRLLHCYIWPIVLYGCEAWTIKEDLRKRLEAFEMWTFRRMLSISWTQKITNAEVLKRVGQTRNLMQTIKKRKVAYLGHVFRNDRYELLQLIMMGKIAGKRGVGRRKKSWLRNIREWTGIKSAAELFHLARDKERFLSLMTNLQ